MDEDLTPTKFNNEEDAYDPGDETADDSISLEGSHVTVSPPDSDDKDFTGTDDDSDYVPEDSDSSRPYSRSLSIHFTSPPQFPKEAETAVVQKRRETEAGAGEAEAASESTQPEPTGSQPSFSSKGTTNESPVKMKAKKKIFSLLEKKSRKRKRNEGEWRKHKAARDRAAGKDYLSYKNQPVPAKKAKLDLLCPNSCRLKCSTKFNHEERGRILSDFYNLDINGKNVHLFRCIRKFEIARRRTGAHAPKTASYKYFVRNGEGREIQVCKRAMCALYQVGPKKIEVVKGKSFEKGSTAPEPDQRGRHQNRPHKITEEVLNFVKAHIASFPAEESHYSRNRNIHKKYLSPSLNVKKMYEMYLEECKDKPDGFQIKLGSYYKIFENHFNLSFGSPRSDTCNTCDLEAGPTAAHLLEVSEASDAMKADRESGRKGEITFVTVDLQQTMPLPKVTTGKAFYLRQLWFYNLSIHCIEKKEKPFFFTWTENEANRGSQEICSAFIKFFEEEGVKEHIIVWSDSCAGQNKNFHTIAVYNFLILAGYAKIIDHKFPVVGHTYLDSDRDFGRIEKNLRNNATVGSPDGYRKIIRESGKNCHVFEMGKEMRDIEGLASDLQLFNRKKNVLKQTVKFRDGIRWLRVDEWGSYLYKESYDANAPFHKVDIRKYIKNGKQPHLPTLRKIDEDYGTISAEKKKDIETLLPFVPLPCRAFFEKIIYN